jgi:hypothetical protein
MTKTTNDLKKGDRVLLNYGIQNGELTTCDTFEKWLSLDFNNSSYKSWEARVMDNKKGNTRFLEVHGWEKDLGSVYSHQIIGWFDTSSGTWQPITHTEAQLKLKQTVKGLSL